MAQSTLLEISYGGSYVLVLNGPQHEKTYNSGFGPNKVQTSLLSYEDWPEY